MSKLKSIDKQLEEMSMKWYINEYYGEQLRVNNTREYRNYVIRQINKSVNKNDIIKEYLAKHPKVKRQYINKKRRMTRIEFLIGAGALTAAVVVGAYTVSKNKQATQTEKQAIEYTLYEEPEVEENEYDKFFEETRNIENTNRRDEKIIKFTKEKIVEAYNMKNPNHRITVESLEYLHLNENVVAHIDARGYDVSYDRISQKEQYHKKKNEVLKNMSIYEFKIDGKTVAVYNGQGDEIIDNSIENKEVFFKNTIELLRATEKLKGAYIYNNSEYDTSKIEDNYENTAEKLIEKQQNKEVNNEIVK